MPALHMRTHASVISIATTTFSSGFKRPSLFISSDVFVNGHPSDRFRTSSHCSFGLKFLCLTEAANTKRAAVLDYNLTMQQIIKNKKGFRELIVYLCFLKYTAKPALATATVATAVASQFNGNGF
jgi:hypothetical protein